MSLLCSIKFKHDGILRWYTISQLSSVPLPLCFCCFCSFPFRYYFFFFFSLDLDPFLSIFLSFKILRLLCAIAIEFLDVFHNLLQLPSLFGTRIFPMNACHFEPFLVLCAFDGMSTLFIVFTRNEFHFYIFFLSSSSVQLLQFLLTHIPPVVGAFAVRLFATRRWTQNP